ncbi:MAG: FG-GAP repeat protein, partial [Candidatus Omnitrophica bacterium]|nr:FG-GAP repeat protein [Candidatus Omnitrophota bacterium]
FGNSVSGIPDLTGDGRGDVVISAPEENPGVSPQGAGRAYVFNGSTGEYVRTLVSPNEQENGRFGAGFGQAVGGVEDINGDGRGEVIVSGWAETPGRAYIFDGMTGGLLKALSSLNGPTAGASFGDPAVAGVSDANGDGKGDVIVGSSGEHPGESPVNSGRAFVFFSPLP